MKQRKTISRQVFFLVEGFPKQSQIEVAEGKATLDHEDKHLDEAERLALADSTGKTVHSNSKSS